MDENAEKTKMKTMTSWWMGAGIFVAVTILFVGTFITQSIRVNTLERAYTARGGTVLTKPAWGTSVSQAWQHLGLPVPRRVYGVYVPRDVKAEEWKQLRRHRQLRHVSLEGTSFAFHPDQIPRSVDSVTLGSLSLPEGFKSRPDLTFHRD